MRNPSLPATEVTDIDPGRLTCYGCGRVIFSTAQCVMTGAKLFHDENCADLTAIRRLRRSGKAMTY